MTRTSFVVLLAVYGVLCTVGLILMKRGLPTDVVLSPITGDGLRAFLAACFNVRLVVGFACYAGSFALSLAVLAAMPLNLAYPLITAASYVGAVLAAVFVLHERLTWTTGLGIALIGVGVMLVARSSP